MTKVYDAIVIGLGGMGAAACCSLARRGRQVLGLEQFDLGHDLGSSGAGLRIYRFAYFLDPAYVPLMRFAHEQWARLERDADTSLLVRTGGLDIGLPDSAVFRGAQAACEQHGLVHDVLSAAELSRRHPAWQLPSDFRAVFQPDAGFLDAEQAVFAHAKVALRNGADLHLRETVTRFHETGTHVMVETDRGRYEARSLIVTAGPWTGKLVPALQFALTPQRQVVGWYHPRAGLAFSTAMFPVFIIEDELGHTYYGFPEHRRPGFKIGRHGHRDETTDPESIKRTIDATDKSVLGSMIERFLPGAAGRPLSLKTCMYTNTADNHFVIDALPGHKHTWVAAGFSGHGYKFCAGIGECLADLACDGRTAQPMGLFSIGRLANA